MIRSVEALVNIPNILSVSRIIAAPVMFVFAVYGFNDAFLILFIGAILTDGLDGFIARAFHCESDFGGRLDTWGDLAVFSVLPICVYLLWPIIIVNEIGYISIAIISILLPLLLGFIKFNKLISFHTYLSKVSLFLVSVSVLIMIIYCNNILFHIAVFVEFFAGLEIILIEIRINKYRDNIKSFFFLNRQ